ncbi:hypothetical protein ACTMSW_14230 [Micromonospora sp. BQ11]|uniref:hypothetical protein n=1 Tax=Micromonospora sp. BQ11 TaxID=3452212 RepID=UPI003F8A4607
MDAVDRPVDGPDVSVTGPRPGAAVLTVATLLVLAAGGWWWRVNEPPTGPVVGTPSTATTDRPAESPPFTVDVDSGIAYRTDPDTGRVTLVVPPDTDGTTLHSFPDTVWRERSVLTPAEGIVRQARAEAGERHLLQFRCTGPGELLVVVDGARAADPFTAGCNGSTTSTEVTGAGGPFQVSLSAAGAEPLTVEAQLVLLP